MIFQDDRTEEQKATLVYGVAGTDRFMSGWGKAAGGTSVAVWACTADLLSDCELWVSRRGDMQRVRTVTLRNYRPRAAHVHVYVYDAAR